MQGKCEEAAARSLTRSGGALSPAEPILTPPNTRDDPETKKAARDVEGNGGGGSEPLA